MTKKDFQKELQTKVKPGVKPSDLKKLKRSKSASDIPTSLPVTNNSDPPNILLQDQLKAKQIEIESLRKQLEEKNTSTTELTELDNSLFARHKSLKDWFIQYQKTEKLEDQLAENIEHASEELISQDKKISTLQNQLSNLKREKDSLQRDLQLASRLAASRKVPYFPTDENFNYLKYALYSLCAVGFTLWLTNNLRKENKHYGKY